MQPILVNNVIADGTRIEGEVRLDGAIRIEGRVHGKIYSRNGRVYVAKTGIVTSDIHSKQVVIGGKVVGNIYSKEHVKILQTGHLVGNIYTASISTDEGAVFEGECSIIK